MIYVNLKDFRAKHSLHQADLATILGCTQSFVSRMEKYYYELDDSQYARLVEKYGEKEVALFEGESPIKNAVSKERRVRRKINSTPSSYPTEIKTLTEIINKQQDEITRLNARVAELTDLFIAKNYPEKAEQIKATLEK